MNPQEKKPRRPAYKELWLRAKLDIDTLRDEADTLRNQRNEYRAKVAERDLAIANDAALLTALREAGDAADKVQVWLAIALAVSVAINIYQLVR